MNISFPLFSLALNSLHSGSRKSPHLGNRKHLFKKYLFIWLCCVLAASCGVFQLQCVGPVVSAVGLDALWHVGSSICNQGSPALQGGFLTIGTTGNSQKTPLKREIIYGRRENSEETLQDLVCTKSLKAFSRHPRI